MKHPARANAEEILMRSRRPRRTAVLLLLSWFTLSPDLTGANTDDLTALLASIKAVGREGKGNAEAGKAWRRLVQLGPDALPAVLAAMDGADPAATNWLRAAADAIAERALEARQPLPAARLEAFIRQTQHAGAARRVAYEWLTRIDPTAADRLLPGMLNDPGAELRRDAVARVIKEADERFKREDKAGATAGYQKALAAALDRDQVDQIAKQLRALDVKVDLASHFGFVRHWQLANPFDNTAGKGFDVAYPPEKGVDLQETYEGKKGEKARWVEHKTDDSYGLVDLNKALGKQMGVVAYGFAAVHSPAERPVEIRAGSVNAVKIFLNGKQVFFREEYHHGMRMDQHVAAGTLKAGRNEILIKVCQNEQTEDWAQNWRFQLRICDAIGGAVPFTVDQKN
jgi:hypothetical protein